jgi:hypothetical protein
MLKTRGLQTGVSANITFTEEFLKLMQILLLSRLLLHLMKVLQLSCHEKYLYFDNYNQLLLLHNLPLLMQLMRMQQNGASDSIQLHV